MRRARAALVERGYGHRDAALILVCVEGPADEGAYFKQLKAIPDLLSPRVRVLVESPANDRSAPRHVLDHAIEVVESVEKRGIDEVWLVNDRDRWTDLRAVAGEASRRGWRVVVSNPCFQVWLLLHLVATPPSGGCRALKAAWGKASHARSSSAFALTAVDVRLACEHAEAWEADHPSAGVLPHNPGTHVHHLVRRLLSSQPT